MDKSHPQAYGKQRWDHTIHNPPTHFSTVTGRAGFGSFIFSLEREREGERERGGRGGERSGHPEHPPPFTCAYLEGQVRCHGFSRKMTSNEQPIPQETDFSREASVKLQIDCGREKRGDFIDLFFTTGTMNRKGWKRLGKPWKR